MKYGIVITATTRPTGNSTLPKPFTATNSESTMIQLPNNQLIGNKYWIRSPMNRLAIFGAINPTKLIAPPTEIATVAKPTANNNKRNSRIPERDITIM